MRITRKQLRQIIKEEIKLVRSHLHEEKSPKQLMDKLEMIAYHIVSNDPHSDWSAEDMFRTQKQRGMLKKDLESYDTWDDLVRATKGS